eukprot:TRINITY_DN11930_c0_g1_i1.p1 TRINITY_DN11930_c0_g1~~TRINITY_DN11930_c0_g1_i1.p1  ORF type:complete len:263 (-),score=40.34 TRINITY_DN11930_c0_g1_i1:84-872(-)
MSVSRRRTHDIELQDDSQNNSKFSDLLLSPKLLKGLTEAGYIRPSPIQLKGIPLGKLGVDLIAQAKSGTGKTCVFSVISLESVIITNRSPQALILAPTREIAQQIHYVITTIGKYLSGLKCEVFIGGTELETDKENLRGCHIVVGTPGRIKSLIETKELRTDTIRMFILDEVEKLLDPSFQPQINWIYSTLSPLKQMLVFSATYPSFLLNLLSTYMKSPQYIMLSPDSPSLAGVTQYHHLVEENPSLYLMWESKVSIGIFCL